MNILERTLIVALAEIVAYTGSRFLTVSEPVLLLSTALRSDQRDALEETLNLLCEKRSLIADWNLLEGVYNIELADSFPTPEITTVEKEKIVDQRLRRILLFRLCEEYRVVGHKLVSFPLASLSESLGVTKQDIRREVDYLMSKYLIEYRVADGGQCTCDLSDSGLEMCEDRQALFDTFSAIQASMKTAEPPVEVTGHFVSNNRIAELETIENPDLDLRKLVQLCKEANVAYENGCLLSLAMIQRTIINHVPPIFGYQTFTEVVNNYSGSKSFKQLMDRLEGSLRRVADSHLHQVVRRTESLPEMPQVDFRTEIDVLLAEIISILQ